MAFKIGITPGFIFNEVSDVLTPAKLNQAFSEAIGVLLEGEIENSNIPDAEITDSKLVTTLDFSGKTITWPVKESTFSNFTGALVTPDSKGQVGLVSSGIYSGAIFIANGTTASDWVYCGHVDSTDITAAPAYVGQWAYSSGALYLATGTATLNDWTEAPQVNGWTFNDQALDLAGVVGKISLYAKTVSGQQNLYIRKGTGTPVRLSGSTPLAGAAAPDWESPWKTIGAGSEYDLSDTGVGGFSEGVSALDTIASPTADNPNFRVIQVLFRKAGATHYVMMPPSSYERAGASNSGYTITVDPVSQDFYLITSTVSVWAGYLPVGAALAVNWGLSGAVTLGSGEMKIRIWT